MSNNGLSAARIAWAVCKRPAEPPLPCLPTGKNSRRRLAHPRVVACRLQPPPRCSHPIRKPSVLTSCPSRPSTPVQGFFRSLFTAGFSESLLNVHSPDQIDLVFDDRNITRAGQSALQPLSLSCSLLLSIRVCSSHSPLFLSAHYCLLRVCISRLYGGGPPLYIPPCLIPSTTLPLSPSFYEGFSWGKRPDNHHPAAPRFLLSLLATATFLSIPTIAAQALSCILRTIGPHTVIKYLNFALGQHIGSPDDAEHDAAVGLEHVAQLLEHSDHRTDLSEDVDSEEPDQVISSHDMSGIQVCKENPTDSSDEESGSELPVFYYGAVSDKIGEACACWLARWGSDILDCEELLEGIHPSPSPPQPGATQASLFVKRYAIGKNPIPPIWRRGGLGSKWVATLLGADTLFVRGECERYELARRVVELRRRSGILQEEEVEWLKAFEYGIYYETMVHCV